MMNGNKAEINVTPLIDVLLVLLIIFIVIRPQHSTGLAAQTPPQGHGASDGREIVVTVAEDRSVRINSQSVSWEDLDPALRRIFALRAQSVLFVAGAPQADFEDIARVLDTARGAGIRRIALMPRDH